MDFIQMSRCQALDDMVKNPRSEWCYHKFTDGIEIVAWDDEARAAYTYTCDTLGMVGRRFYAMRQLKPL